MSLEVRLLDAFAAAHPAELARRLESMPASEAASVFAELSLETLAQLLPRLLPLSAATSLELLEQAMAGQVLSLIRRDAAAAILRVMGAARREEVLRALEPAARKELTPLLRYAEGTAGALMDPAVLAVVESVTVGEALERLRRSSMHALYYVYVVSESQQLVGVANIRQLMAARPDELVGLIATRPVDSLLARASSETVIDHPGWKRFHALPVVDGDGRFLGAVRYRALRALEGRLVDAGLQDQSARTAAALGELYGLGIRGLMELWAAAFLGRGDEVEGERR